MLLELLIELKKYFIFWPTLHIMFQYEAEMIQIRKHVLTAI